MNHDYEHCIDFKDDCPESCHRARLVRDLEENYPEMEVSWMNFSDCPDCERNRLANNSPKLENENCDTISRQAAIDALKRVPGVGNTALDKIRELPPIQVEQDWIPVSKELPKLRHDVWLTVFFHESWMVVEGYRQDGEFMFWYHGRLESALDEENRVTAWKPKSKPYQPDAK